MVVTKAILASYIAGLTPRATPYPIEITETIATDWGSSETVGTVGDILRDTPAGVYIDLGSTTIPNSVTSMRHTFYGCTSIVNAPVIPNSVTSMRHTFYGCTSIVNAPVIPNSVIIMQYTFFKCTSLVNAPEIPNSVTSMQYTFYGCTSLVNAPEIPNSVTSMQYTFYGCTSLVNAPVIPNSVINMEYTFCGCTSIVNAPVIPNSVINMNTTFYGCTSLKTIENFLVDVPNCNMTNAFYNCPALEAIYVPAQEVYDWYLLYTNTKSTGTDYYTYDTAGTLLSSGTVAGTNQVLSVYGKSDELVISNTLTPERAIEAATTRLQHHKIGLSYNEESFVLNAKNPDNVICNFLDKFATQALAIKPLGNSIALPATPTSVTKIVKVATISWSYNGTINISSDGNSIADGIKVVINGGHASSSGLRVIYGKVSAPYGIKKIIVTSATGTWNSDRNIYAEIVNYPNNDSSITLGVVETNRGIFTPSMTELSSVEGTVVDSLSLDYLRGDISSYQHEFTKSPTAPTPAAATNSTQIATTAFVKAQLLAVIYPIGCYYTQYPNADSNVDATEFPVAQRPETLFGGKWDEQWATESVFFRTRGTLSDKLRTNGKQEDQMQGHKHYSQAGDGAHTVNTVGSALASIYSTEGTGVPITDGTNGTPRTGSETRTVNRRIKVWKRTA